MVSGLNLKIINQPPFELIFLNNKTIDNEIPLLSRGGHSKVYELNNCVIKKFNENSSQTNDGYILEQLQDIPYYPKLYCYNKEIVVMEKAEGELLVDLIRRGKAIDPLIYKHVQKNIELTLQNGFIPVELEEDHIYVNLTSPSVIKVVDVGWYQKIEIQSKEHLEYESEIIMKHFINRIHR